MITYAPYNSIAYPSSRWSKSSFSYGFSAPFPHPNFTGKETDCETGYSYFGARYYDPTLLTSWTAVDPMADKYPDISPYAYCAWNPMNSIDPNGMDSVHSPNGMINAGTGYKVTPDGQYLYGEGLQTKKWNPNLEIGGVVGQSGGYEDCNATELTAYGIALGAMTNVAQLDGVVGVGSDGCFSYKRTKNGELAHGTACNRVKPISKSILGKGVSRGAVVVSVLLSADEVRNNLLEHGLDSPETYSAIGGAIGTGLSMVTFISNGALVGAAFGGIGAIPGAIVGFAVGIGVSIGLEQGGRALGEAIYNKKTH